MSKGGTTVGTAYVQIVPSAQGIKGGIEDVLEPQMAPAGKRAGGIFGNAFGGAIGGNQFAQSLQNLITGTGGSFGENFKDVLGAVGGAALNGLKTAGAAAVNVTGKALEGTAKLAVSAVGDGLRYGLEGAVKLGQQAVESYAEFEQLTGGVETLFGAGGKGLAQYAAAQGKSIQDVEEEFFSLRNAQNTVMENAAQAFKTAGMSQNEYMELAVQTGASLISSLGGDTVVASRLMDTAITDMADNVNKMGTSMESVQNAYKGFSKGNFTMLDNLALGYGGTKEEMQRLLDDAQELSGMHFNLDSYADIVSAIHVVQESMGVAGTTAKEAENTISGSVNMLKASWSNLLTGFASGDDISGLVSNVISSGTTVLENVLPVAEQALSGITEAIQGVLDSGVLSEAFSGLLDNLPDVLGVVGDLILTMLGAMAEAGPQLLDAGVQLVLQLINGIKSGDFVNTAIETVLTLVSALIAAAPQLLAAGVELIVQLIAGLSSHAGEIGQMAIEIVTTLVTGFIDAIPQMLDAGRQLIQGLIDGIKGMLSKVGEAIQGVGEHISSTFRKLVGIESPSKLFRYFGEMIDIGLAKGITGNVSTVEDAMGLLTDTATVQPQVFQAARSSLGMQSGLAGITPGNLGQLASAIVNGLSTQLSGQGGSAEAAIYIDGDRIGRAMLPYNRKWAKATPEVIFG